MSILPAVVKEAHVQATVRIRLFIAPCNEENPLKDISSHGTVGTQPFQGRISS